MISAYATDNGKLRPLSDPLGACLSALWVDVKAPTPEEEAALEKAFGLDIPTREEMEEIEVSSRLYTENGAAYATALVMSKTDTDAPVVSPVTFILSDKRLITVRYEDPRAFTVFPTRAAKSPIGGDAPDLALVGLLEALIERMADLSERITRDIDRVSRSLDFKGRIERENWVEQARILSAGGQTEFSRRVDRGEVETSRAKT